ARRKLQIEAWKEDAERTERRRLPAADIEAAASFLARLDRARSRALSFTPRRLSQELKVAVAKNRPDCRLGLLLGLRLRSELRCAAPIAVLRRPRCQNSLSDRRGRRSSGADPWLAFQRPSSTGRRREFSRPSPETTW